MDEESMKVDTSDPLVRSPTLFKYFYKKITEQRSFVNLGKKEKIELLYQRLTSSNMHDLNIVFIMKT